MLKKFVLLAFLCVPLGMIAQEVKIAHVNTVEIFNAMPETSAAETALANLNQEVRAELQRLQSEYERKLNELQQQQDSLSEATKANRIKEIQEAQNRIETFYPQAEQQIADRTKELQAPIIQKIQTAIKAIGEEHGYTYMMEAGGFLFISPKAVDATSLVKAKLGLK